MDRETLKLALLKRQTLSLHAYGLYDRTRIFLRLFGGGVPINSTSSASPFFIIGSGRSGSTLLRALLSKSPELVIPPESYVLPEIIRKYRTLKRLEWDEVVSIILGTFTQHANFCFWQLDLNELGSQLVGLPVSERSLAKILDQVYFLYGRQNKPSAWMWGDKTPRNTLYLGWISRIYPQAKYIHLVRDGRDAVASFLKANLFDNLEDASARWLASVRAAARFGRSSASGSFFEVKYEELVSAPEPVLKELCLFLGVKYSEDMLSHGTGVENLGDSKLPHHSNLAKPVTDASIGKWKSFLSVDEQVKVERILGKELRRWGYIAE